ncbi:MAG TPA: ferritin-like domain-containing protein [Actinomycetota bacterium]|nr:ferritin-like domain-containing protein [Actinomycetota bacterium]
MSDLDLAKYLSASRKLDLEGIDFRRAADFPVSREEIRVLTYMMDIETHTVVYLRDLLASQAAYDPDITAFLSLWVYEELWHGEALAAFLRAVGERHAPARITSIRCETDRGGAVARWLKTLAARRLPSFVAVHMAWGAINELSTLHGYKRLIATTRNPVLRELLTRIVKDERRHYAFYRAKARVLLKDNPQAQRLVRRVLARFWAPVGTGVRPQAETDFAVAHLFGDAEGTAVLAAMDDEIEQIDGLAGLQLLTRARAGALRRASVPSIEAPSPVSSFKNDRRRRARTHAY